MLRFAHMVFVWVFIIVMPVWCACLTFFFSFLVILVGCIVSQLVGSKFSVSINAGCKAQSL